ncbi:hypothetical protein HAPAU_38690 [Halalkalicoccus paucihalophilus]|uniref:Uncharacterized protein n=1 Tax=Halalkalicoccus paucihalophilus TaxID=1008153 RepID=A0A151A8A2_9EURY|nr:hypothetical protein HAPAU_38690 [Halalkalicoccus paucihalophilus]
MSVAGVKEIVPASDAALSRPLESYTGDQVTFDQNKRVIVFEPESLYELSRFHWQRVFHMDSGIRI